MNSRGRNEVVDVVTGVSLFVYRVRAVVSNYDGDTVTVVVDLGFSVYREMTFRLFGVDTAELRGNVHDRPLAEEAKRFTQTWLRNSSETGDLLVVSHKDRTGKYGRYLGDFVCEGRSLSKALLRYGLAVPYPG